MTAKRLISLLKKYPDDAEVFISLESVSTGEFVIRNSKTIHGHMQRADDTGNAVYLIDKMHGDFHKIVGAEMEIRH